MVKLDTAHTRVYYRYAYRKNSLSKKLTEGQNLLVNRYNQATRNLPVEAVAQVQVMENDQPIKA